MSGINTSSIADGLDIALGRVPGYSIINKFGHNIDVDAPEDICDPGGDYTGQPLTGADTVTVVSSSISDTANGVGATGITITGLDANYNVQSETIPLNGIVGSTTTKIFSRVYVCRVTTAGSALSNVGALTVRHTTIPTNVFTVMAAGLGQASISAYTVPAGHTGYLVSYRGSMMDSTANQAKLAFVRREPGMAQITQLSFIVSTQTRAEITLFGAVRFPEKTDIKVRCLSVDNPNADIHVGYDLVLVKS